MAICAGRLRRVQQHTHDNESEYGRTLTTLCSAAMRDLSALSTYPRCCGRVHKGRALTEGKVWLQRWQGGVLGTTRQHGRLSTFASRCSAWFTCFAPPTLGCQELVPCNNFYPTFMPAIQSHTFTTPPYQCARGLHPPRRASHLSVVPLTGAY